MVGLTASFLTRWVHSTPRYVWSILLESEGIELQSWPAQSPDVNPIDNG